MEKIAREVTDVEVSQELKDSYMTYAMSVIFARALPVANDGLKPVQRRIIYTMYEMGLYPNRQHVKCARVTGEVSGKYHPHGSEIIYPSLARLAQDFNMRYPLVDGMGNFGSIDGDPPGAQRYTECRLAPPSMDLLADIDEDTVDFQPNYDERDQEPVVLPAKFPNLLANGGSGIAVGMATNIPPHNINEVCDAIAAVIDNPNMSLDELLELIPGPDFPTGGVILGTSGIRQAYETGHGSIVLQARASVEPISGGKQAILITELPYNVNKANLVTQIADLVRQKKVEGISDIRDETDRKGMRLVIELKREANPSVVLHNLYKRTSLRTNFAVNMLALVDGVPRTLTLRRMIDIYIEHRREVITRRTKFRLRQAEDRAHILEGYLRALDMLDEVIELIRASQSPAQAREALIAQFGFTERQAQAILDLTLSRLTALERQKIQKEHEETIKLIAYLEEILANPRRVDQIIKDDLRDIKKTYGDERRTHIRPEEPEDITVEQLIAEQDVIITITKDGYIKRLPLDTYRVQRRGGKGVIGLTKKEEDEVSDLFVASTHHYILFFTDQGRVYRLKAFEVPVASRQARGTAIVNLLPLEPGEHVTAAIAVKDFRQGGYLVMVTENGIIKKTRLKDFDTPLRARGLTAIKLRDGDALRWVRWTDGKRHLILVTRNGQAIRFDERQVRLMGRAAAGVRAISLAKGDSLVGCQVVERGKDLLIVCEKGYGKRTPLTQYPCQARGGKGRKTAKVTERNGHIVACEVVDDEDQVVLITSGGLVIRIPADKIRVTGRATQGVILVKMAPGEVVRSAAKVVRHVQEDNRR